MKKTRYILVWTVLGLLAYPFTGVATERDESGIGGTGHKPKPMIDLEDIEALDIPERIDMPAGIDEIDLHLDGSDLSIEAADQVEPPPQDGK